MATSCPWTTAGTCGFSTMWAVASAADRVMVMMKSVAANPSRTRTNSLPFQNDSSRSSIAIEPWPCGLSSATLRYTGNAPKRVRATSTRVAIGDRHPGGQGRDAGLVAQRGEVVHAGQAHHLPPRVLAMGVDRLGVGPGVLRIRPGGGVEEPGAEAVPLLRGWAGLRRGAHRLPTVASMRPARAGRGNVGRRSRPHRGPGVKIA